MHKQSLRLSNSRLGQLPDLAADDEASHHFPPLICGPTTLETGAPFQLPAVSHIHRTGLLVADNDYYTFYITMSWQ